MTNTITSKISKFFAISLIASLASIFGCEGGGGGSSHDFGDNDPNVVACVGDSLTQGYACEGSPYPSILASMSGKTVHNYGVGGTCSDYGASVIGSVLARKPGYVIILFGANDAIMGRTTDNFKNNLNSMINACKANNSHVILGTTTPMIGPHIGFNEGATRMAQAAREVASDQGVSLVDMHKAYGSGESYLVADGLHYNAEGGQLFASKFNSKL